MYEIAQDSPGRLWIMPCPAPDGLFAQAQHYRARGADHIVSMLTCDEAAQLGLAEEGPICAAAGLGFTQHGIVDFGLPDMAKFRVLVQRIHGLLTRGQGVAVHCRAGIGRSGMVTCGVLIASGMSPDDAIEKVAHARGVSIPDTVEQGSFVKEFATCISGNFG